MKVEKTRVNLSVDLETAERLRQYAREHHTTVSGAITQLIWSLEVKDNGKADQDTNIQR